MINHNVVRCAVPSLPPSSRISRGRHVILRAPFFNLRFSTISPFSTSLKANSYRVTLPESQVLRYGKIGPVPTRVTLPASPGDAVLVWLLRVPNGSNRRCFFDCSRCCGRRPPRSRRVQVKLPHLVKQRFITDAQHLRGVLAAPPRLLQGIGDCFHLPLVL